MRVKTAVHSRVSFPAHAHTMNNLCLLTDHHVEAVTPPLEQSLYSSSSISYGDSTTPTAGGTIKTIWLPEQQFTGFQESFHVFSEHYNLDTCWNACDAAKTQRYISYAFTHMMRWLPPEVIYDLQTFFNNPASPAALFIRGLPVDDDPLPPTPGVHRGGSQQQLLQPQNNFSTAIASHLHIHDPATPASSSGNGGGSRSAQNSTVQHFNLCQQQPRLPVAESVVMGIAKCLGDPFTFTFKAHKPRGGLLTDLAPSTSSQDYKHRQQLLFHQDFPALCVDGLVLMGVRPDSSEQAYTHVCNNRTLLAALGSSDAGLLRRHKVTLVQPDGSPALDGPFTKQPWWWHAVSGAEDNPVIKLYEPVLAGNGVQVAGATPEVTAAYQRLGHLAAQLADSVLIGRGDLLVVNNQRAVHARSAFKAALDGSDRWLLRVMGVARPGSLYSRVGPPEGGGGGSCRAVWPSLHVEALTAASQQ